MNNKPERPVSEDMLTRWIDGRLQPDELASIESQAAEHPGLLREKEHADAIGRMLRNAMPSSQEPPSADFFTSQLMDQIRQEAAPVRPPVAAPGLMQRLAGLLRTPWFMPVASAAAVALVFLAMDRGGSARSDRGGSFADVYVPDPKVTASAYYSEDAAADVIDLKGLEPLPADRMVRAYDVASADNAEPGEPQVLVSNAEPDRVVMVLNADGRAPKISVLH